MTPTATILLPTFNNAEYLIPCVESILMTKALDGLCKLIIINNGVQPVKEQFKNIPGIEVLEPGRNLGWEGGLKFGMEHVDTNYVCFQNDDTFIPRACTSFYSQLLWPFGNTNIAAVGPATTNASGLHSVHLRNPLWFPTEVAYLIFFTVMLRTQDLKDAGGIELSPTGSGDDLDLSIRLRKMGKKLLINPDAFIFHHAFKTGEKVRGPATVAGGWNSQDMMEKTRAWIIQKHGFKTYMSTMRPMDYSVHAPLKDDVEASIVAPLVTGEKVVELGCGFNKTVPQAIGVDRVAKDEACQNLAGHRPCVADVQADVSQPLPFPDLSVDTIIARHVLEHITDTIETLTNWNRVLKIGGRLLIAVPNQELVSSIPLNPEHVHAFTPASLSKIVTLCGFQAIQAINPGNGHTFIAHFEKVTHPVKQKSVEELVGANGH